MKSTLTAAFLSLLGGATANQHVMELIYNNWLKLYGEGFFEKSMLRTSVFNQAQTCRTGKVTIDGEDFSCSNIDFLSYVSTQELEILDVPHLGVIGATSADIWGWLSPTGREFTLLALDNGAVALDSTDPQNPCIVAKMPTGRTVDQWADVKVYKNVMYHVKDTRYGDTTVRGTDNHAIEVYDLEQLDQLDCHVEGWVPLNLFPTTIVRDHGRSHNVVVNTESGKLYSVGTEKCSGGLVIYDIKDDPLNPVEIGCADNDGYTHDAQCLTYDGPDPDYQGEEICFGYNEETMTVWHVKADNTIDVVSRTFYPDQVYCHQGWVNDDLTKVLMDDELNELCAESLDNGPYCTLLNVSTNSAETRTSTNVFDITDLDNPIFEGAYLHADRVVDHNLYVWGTIHRKGWGGNPPMENHPDPHFAYMNNYLAGVKVVDIFSEDFNEWSDAGYFDIAPDRDEIAFAGAWSGYMHPSGVYAVSSIERGLFFLAPRMAFTVEFPQADNSGGGGSDDGGNDDDGGGSDDGGNDDDGGEDDDGDDSGGGNSGSDDEDTDSVNPWILIVPILLIAIAILAGIVLSKKQPSQAAQVGGEAHRATPEKKRPPSAMNPLFGADEEDA